MIYSARVVPVSNVDDQSGRWTAGLPKITHTVTRGVGCGAAAVLFDWPDIEFGACCFVDECGKWMLTEIVVKFSPFPLLGVSALERLHFAIGGRKGCEQKMVASFGCICGKSRLGMLQRLEHRRCIGNVERSCGGLAEDSIFKSGTEMTAEPNFMQSGLRRVSVQNGVPALEQVQCSLGVGIVAPQRSQEGDQAPRRKGKDIVLQLHRVLDRDMRKARQNFIDALMAEWRGPFKTQLALLVGIIGR